MDNEPCENCEDQSEKIRELLDKIDVLEEEIDVLKQENIELREDIKSKILLFSDIENLGRTGRLS